MKNVFSHTSMLPAVQKRGASRSSRLSFGEKTLFLYFLVFYFFPIGMDFFSDVQLKYFLRGDLPFTLPFAFAAFYLFTILSLRRIIDIDIKIKAPLRKVIPSKIILYAVFSIFLVAAFSFSQTFSSAFRHNQSYSNAGLLPMITFSAKAICHIFIFASLSSRPLIKLDTLHYIFYFAGLYFAFVSSYDIIWAVVGILSWLAATRVDIVNIAKNAFSNFSFPLILAVVPAVVFGGMANKLGFEGAIDYFSDGLFSGLFELFKNRIFYHSYSLAVQFSDIENSFTRSAEALSIIGHQSLRRLLILVGNPILSETHQTVSRLNYLVISNYNVASDAGASPGLLGSIFYLPGSFLALPIHIICISNLIGMIDNIIGKGRNNPIAYFASLALLQALADAFMDNFNPFSIGFIILAMMFVMSSYARTVPDPADR